MNLFDVEIIPLKFEYNCCLKWNRCTERYVEIPIALAFIQNIIRDENYTELGCTCPYYFDTTSNHLVFDLTDNHPDNVKKDFRDFTDDDYRTNVISISTIEHINQPQYGIGTRNEHEFGASVILEKILKFSKKYLITIPLGQNKNLDQFIIDNYAHNDLVKFVGRSPLKTDKWDIIPFDKLNAEHFIDGSYQNANCICVISNCF